MRFNTFFLKLKSNKAVLQTLLFLIVTFLVSSFSLFLSYVLKHVNPAEYGLIQDSKQDLEITYKEILFFASMVIAFFLLSVSLRYIKHRNLRAGVMCFALVYLAAACFIIVADIIYYLIFAYRLTFSVVQTVLNTNTEEVQGFVKLYASAGSIITLLLFMALIVLVIFKRAWFMALFLTPSFFIISLLITVFGIIDFGQVAHMFGNGPHNVRYWDIIIGEYNEYHEFNRRLEAEKNTHTLSKEYDGFYKQDTVTKTLVFVISESLSKRHMSLYGYPRATTPGLDTNKSIYRFNNCIAPAALTIESVPAMFFNGYLAKRINLIALLNKLGYETAWISNQSGWGKRDGSIVLLSQLCKTTAFVDEKGDDDKANASFHDDMDVLAPFEKAMQRTTSASKFIVVHLMGCHFDYEKRYPAAGNNFTSVPPSNMAVSIKRTHDIVNSYDNAMLYHESVVNGILQTFSKYSHDKNAALVFLSDHGEELYENRDYAGHGYPPTRAMAEIPYFTTLSAGFKKNYPAVERAMINRCNTPYSAANNFYTLIHLLNINSKTYKNKILKNGFFSPRYDSLSPRIIMGMDYSKINF